MGDVICNKVSFALLLGLLVAALAGQVRADKFEWDEVTDADWSVSRDSARGIFDAVVLFEKITADHKDFMDRQFKRTVYLRIRILGPEGREWADVEAPFLHLEQDVKEIKGRTILRDGTIIELDKQKIFEKQVLKTKGEEYTQYTFSLPGVTEDCIIEYMIRYELPSFVGEWIIQKEIPVLRFEEQWVLPKLNISATGAALDRIIDLVTPNYLWLNTFSDVDVQQLPNLKKPEWLEFSCGFVPAFKSEPFTVPDDALKTKLYTYYGSRVPPATYWGEEGRDLESILTDFCKKDKRVKKVVEQFSGLPDDEAKIAAAYNWIRDSLLNLTYFDLTEWEGQHRVKIDPDKVEDIDDVLKYRYGRRADLDKTFADMLREMNIDAKYCYAKDRFDDLFVSEAKYWQLDRSLVAVSDGVGKYRFYSVGHDCTPIGTVPWFLEGVQALIGGSTDLFVPIPFSPSSFSTTQVTYEIEMTEDLEPFGSVAYRMTGHDARDVRGTILDKDTSEFAGLLREDIEEQYPNAKLDSIAIDQYMDITQPVLMHCHLTYPEIETAGSKILLKPFDFCTEVENPFFAPERHMAILFKYAHEMRESAHIALPEGYTVAAMPTDTSFANDIGSCTIGFQQTDDGLLAQRFFTLNRPFWGVVDYPLVKALFQARQDLSGLTIVLAESDNTGGVDESPSQTPPASEAGAEGE